MTEFKKATIKVITGKDVETASGYEYQYALATGKYVPMWVCKREGDWRVIDPNTGRYICKGSKTREDAVKLADSMEVKPVFTNFIESAKYGDYVMEFKRKCGEDYTIAAEKDGDVVVVAEVEHHDLTEKPKATSKPKAPAKPKAPKKPTAKKPTAKKPAAKKPTPKKDGELAKALKEIEALKKELADLKAEKVEEVVSEWTIESVRKWAVPRGFVADQVNPERKDCIWVYGVRKDDKATQKELMSMGFRWGKKGWYVDPKRG